MILARAGVGRSIKNAAGEKTDRAAWFWRSFIIGPMVPKHVKVMGHCCLTGDHNERRNISVCKEKV